MSAASQTTCVRASPQLGGLQRYPNRTLDLHPRNRTPTTLARENSQQRFAKNAVFIAWRPTFWARLDHDKHTHGRFDACIVSLWRHMRRSFLGVAAGPTHPNSQLCTTSAPGNPPQAVPGGPPVAIRPPSFLAAPHSRAALRARVLPHHTVHVAWTQPSRFAHRSTFPGFLERSG